MAQPYAQGAYGQPAYNYAYAGPTPAPSPGYEQQPVPQGYAPPAYGGENAMVWLSRRQRHPGKYKLVHCFGCMEVAMTTIFFGMVIASIAITWTIEADYVCCVPRVGDGSVNAGSALSGGGRTCRTDFFDDGFDGGKNFAPNAAHNFICNSNNNWAGTNSGNDGCPGAIAAVNALNSTMHWKNYAACQAECNDKSGNAPKFSLVLLLFALLDMVFTLWKYRCATNIWNSTNQAEEDRYEKRGLILTIISVTIKVFGLVLAILVGGLGGVGHWQFDSMGKECDMNVPKNFPSAPDSTQLSSDRILEQVRYQDNVVVAVCAFLAGAFVFIGLVTLICGFCLNQWAKRTKKNPGQ